MHAQLLQGQSRSVTSRPRRRHRLVAASLSTALVLAPLAAGLVTSPATATSTIASPASLATPPSKVATQQEQDQAARIPMSEVIAKAVPAKTPMVTKSLPPRTLSLAPEGKAQKFDGATALSSPDKAGTAGITAAAAANVLGVVWPGAYSASPNRQVGKLYYDTNPGTAVAWNVCSGTAINTPNKSFVLTAGHCVFNSDPDKNSRVDGNGYYYQDFRFCPGFENDCKLGTWYYRIADTTPTWYYGSGTARTYDWSDDIAVILMKPNASGYLVNVVGGQGMSFNQPVNQIRTAMGYPAPDTRFTPYYYYSGLDLNYCQGTDSLAVGSTKIWLACRMTGGSSGGPWLTAVNASWGGYANSVNSHKPYGAEYMEGPYFGNAEYALYNKYRSL